MRVVFILIFKKILEKTNGNFKQNKSNNGYHYKKKDLNMIKKKCKKFMKI